MTGAPSPWIGPEGAFETGLHGEKLLDPTHPSLGEIPRDDQQVDIRIVPGRAAPDGAEHGSGHEAIAIPSPEFGEHRIEEEIVALEE